ncbi:MAG: hypothetical protein K0S93_320 [Nitrososphaeraceae archaeon]|jgi:hypothetical protein|nr:hypothetical protein [Nitrososphaeraceae archaeon]
MILSQVKDRIPLEVIDELNLKDTDELFWRKVEQDNSGQIYYIVSKNDLTTIPIENIVIRDEEDIYDILTNKEKLEYFLQEYEKKNYH